MLTDERVEELILAGGGRWHDKSFWKIEDADLHPMARAIEAEVRKECAAELAALRTERDHMEMAADAEARRVDELTELRKEYTELIRQLVEALEAMQSEAAARSCGLRICDETTALGRARLERKS